MNLGKTVVVSAFMLLMLAPMISVGAVLTSSPELEETFLSSDGNDVVFSNTEVVTQEALANSEIIEETLTYTEPQSIPGYRRTGLLFEDMTKFEEFRRGAQESPITPVDSSTLDTANPPSVSNLVGLPPIGNQGSQGSCVGWAYAYYCLTHQVAAANGFWDTTIPSHQYSPAFVYNQINYGEDTGSFHSDASLLLNDFGCATMSTMPYSSSDYITWPSEAAYSESMNYQTTNRNWDNLYTDSDLEVLRTYIADGNTAVTSILTRTAFYGFDSVNNIYTTSHASGDLGGGHAVCVVGYDDNKATTDGPGAFLLVNSWGTSWGDNGFWWMSYEAIKHPDLSRRVFYYCDVIDQPYTPNLIASLRISHEKRGDVLNSDFLVSLEQYGSLEYSKSFRIGAYIADDSGLYQNHPFPGNHILFDLSKFSPYLSTFTENEFIIEIGDSVWPVSGVLESFSVHSTEWDVEATSSQTPHTIPDNQPRGEISTFLSIPSIEIDTIDPYVGGTVEISGISQGESHDTVLDVGFEPGSYENSWYTNDVNPDNGDQLWGIDTYHSYSGGSSIWCGGSPSSTAVYTEHFIMPIWYWPSGWSLYSAGSNTNPWSPIGSSTQYQIHCSTGGLSDVVEWVIQGPLDTASATELCLTFWMDYNVNNAQAGNFASVLYSTDGSSFTYLKRWWAPVGETCSFVGEQKIMLPDNAISSTLYFAFIFQGDYSGSMTVDDIDIWDIGAEYENHADSYVYHYIDVSDFDSATLSFDYWAELEVGCDWFSPAYYIDSAWITPYPQDRTVGWTHFTLAIPIAATRIGFYFHSDYSVIKQGVYVDNVQLVGRIDPISQVEIFIDSVSQGYATGSDTWSYSWDTTQFSDGIHDILASAVFSTNSVNDTGSTFIDNTAPFLNSTTEMYQSGNNITITGYVNSLGGSPISMLTFTSGVIDAYFQDPIAGVMINSTTWYWMFANSTSIPDGYYAFEMTTTDYAGNSHAVAMALTVDNTGPAVSTPPDIIYEMGTTDHSIIWGCTDLNPSYYELYRNGELVSTGSWSSGLEYSVDGLTEGTYTFTIIFWDSAGNSATDNVEVTVYTPSSSTTETTSTTSTEGTDTSTDTGTGSSPSADTPETLMTSVIIVVIAAGSAVVIVVVLILIKRKT